MYREVVAESKLMSYKKYNNCLDVGFVIVNVAAPPPTEITLLLRTIKNGMSVHTSEQCKTHILN